MKKIVIAGAGLHIFYKLRHLIGKKIEITLIDPRSHSLLKPSLPEVAFEGAPIAHSLVELKHTIESKKAVFIQDEITNIDAKSNRLSFSKIMKWGFDNYLYYNEGNIPPDFALKATDRMIRRVV